MDTTETTPPRRRPGPPTIYPGKVRKPITWMGTKAIRDKLKRGRRRERLSNSDFLCLLVDKFADVCTRD